MPDTDSPGLDLLRGTLDLLVLKTLTWGPRHGYAIAEWIAQITDDTLLVEEGTLYPALHRLERKGWIEAEWGLSENNRRAKYYRLTPAGRRRLAQEAESWERFTAAVGKVLRAADSPA
jgi:transcriptional regulator